MNDLISRSDVLELQRYNFGVSMLNSEEYIKVSESQRTRTRQRCTTLFLH